jgi:hypothetical protein
MAGGSSGISSGSDNVGYTWLEQDIHRARDAKKTTTTNGTSAESPAKHPDTARSKASSGILKTASSSKAVAPNGSKAHHDGGPKDNAAGGAPRSHQRTDSKMQFLEHYFRSTNE